jgi:hypothetical protein
MAKAKPTYVGNPKHKNMPHRGVHGSLCPATIDERRAQEMLDAGHPDPKDSSGQGKRYCTDGDDTFCAQCHDLARNEWHGYPVSWPEVPPAIRASWRDAGTVKPRVMRGRTGSK